MAALASSGVPSQASDCDRQSASALLWDSRLPTSPSPIGVSDPWRSDLSEAIGPVASWVIPILLAFLPGLFVGFLLFSLLLLRYRPPSMEPPVGAWAAGTWPAVKVIVAAYNEEDAIEETLKRIAEARYGEGLDRGGAGRQQLDRPTAELRGRRRRTGSTTAAFEPAAGKHHALNTALESVDDADRGDGRRRHPLHRRRSPT